MDVNNAIIYIFIYYIYIIYIYIYINLYTSTHENMKKSILVPGMWFCSHGPWAWGEGNISNLMSIWGNEAPILSYFHVHQGMFMVLKIFLIRSHRWYIYIYMSISCISEYAMLHAFPVGFFWGLWCRGNWCFHGISPRFSPTGSSPVWNHQQPRPYPLVNVQRTMENHHV